MWWRRVLIVMSTAVLVAAFAGWWRQRDEATSTAEAPQWPRWPDADPAARPSATTVPAWVEGSGDAAPAGYPIKLNLSSGIFHVPGGRFYERTNADRWYATAEAAIADGYRQSKT